MGVRATRAASPWRPCFRPRPAATARLFCLPHAGGGSVSFAPWGHALPSVEVCPVEPPGRLTRFREPLVDRMEPLATLLAEEIAPFLDRPYALFGQSLGGLVAFEIARALRAAGAPAPFALVVAGARPPHLSNRERGLHLLPDGELSKELRRLQGTPPEVLSSPALLRIVLPIVRADVAVVETYDHEPGEPISCPVVAFGADHDELAPPSCLPGWSEHTAAGASVHVLPGTHFFPQEDPAALLRLLDMELTRLRNERRGGPHG